MSGNAPARVMMYSHDTFGLGHLRRTREIAHALVEHLKRTSVLIVSGSSIAGAFDFRARVDFIKVPSVIKLYNGSYTSLAEHIDISETLTMRRDMIVGTARTYRPDVFIVDKEPLGLRGELHSTLELLKRTGCRLVLGLRDVLDTPETVLSEWTRSGALQAVERYYDDVWIYGCQGVYDPLIGIPLSQKVRRGIVHTGYLRRECRLPANSPLNDLPRDYLLVTAGGGGDGAPMMNAVLGALEYDASLAIPVVMVLGPFMPASEREPIRERAERLGHVIVLDFEAHTDALIAGSTAVVSMGGYNTFCEILSFDARALLVPRTHPRREQVVRSERARDLGLVDMVDAEAAMRPEVMAAAIRKTLARPRPSEGHVKIDMNGLEYCAQAVAEMVRERAPEPVMQ